jgi:hypothetical protein
MMMGSAFITSVRRNYSIGINLSRELAMDPILREAAEDS